jgi:hypothetical protein
VPEVPLLVAIALSTFLAAPTTVPLADRAVGCDEGDFRGFLRVEAAR